jgi:hypothetical protein
MLCHGGNLRLVGAISEQLHIQVIETGNQGFTSDGFARFTLSGPTSQVALASLYRVVNQWLDSWPNVTPGYLAISPSIP